MKKKLLVKCLVIALAVMLLSSGAGDVGGKSAKVQFNISKGKLKAFHKEVYGFNTNMANGEYAYNDKEIIGLTDRLRPAVLRFPGGTVANYYHWQQAGFKRIELDIAKNDKERERNIGNFEKLREKRKGLLSFDDFMTLCNKYRTKPIIVVNLLTGTPAESAAWVRHVKEKGYKVFGWELGNELYLPSYRGRIKDVEEYIRIARRHAEAMRAIDPDIRLAVVAHPGTVDLLDSGRVNRAERWNSALARERFYNAYAVHPYLKIREFFGDRPAINETTKNSLFEISDTILTRALKTYGNTFRDREWWVTEWNLMLFRDSLEMGDTLLHALYCGDFFTNMVNADIIASAEYHVFAGPWNGYPLISPGQNSGGSGNVIKRACFYSFDILKTAVTQADKKFTVEVRNNPVLKRSNKYTSNPLLGISAASVGTETKTFLLISNRTSSEILADITLNEIKPRDKIKYTYVRADSLDSRGEDNKIEVKTLFETADKLVLPANSFGVVEII